MPGTTLGRYPGAGTAGTEVSSTYEGRHLTLLDTELIHPSRTSTFVNKGDPVILCNAGLVASRGHAVGVALATATAATDYIAIDTEGIFNMTVFSYDDDGGSAIVAGDPLFIHDGSTAGVGANGTGDATISKRQNVTTQLPFGYALGTLGSGGTGVIAVKVHWQNHYQNDLQIRKTIDVADPSALSGAYAAAMKLTVNSDIAQTGGRLCALSVNLEPGSALAAQTITGAEVCTYLAADIAVAGALYGLFVEVQGGLSYASDCYSIYAYLAVNADPTTHAHVMRLEHNSGTAAWLDAFVCFVGDGQAVWDIGPLAENSAWSLSTGANGATSGHIHVQTASGIREIALFTPA